ncbi:MFS transporter [Corynebacterium sp. HMSC078A10]|uniref:MFS transporter n=1 Tax=Corynebacterium sp. HMSC078A10 TaxID=1739312 RepID=UPI0008A4C29B|nr:MFS transporter [Corynebacterium sp. HMSC078A10]OFK62474.1 alpha-ketoglutarate permease [Corynebacterium sp. HMSC078A10]
MDHKATTHTADGAEAAKPRIEWPTIKAILAASSGNLVEWFDFYIYAFFSVYFADQFFSGTGETGALMKSAGVFFIGFLMRPIGGYVFGRIADRYGRKRSMLIAIIMMCAGSLLFAALPTAATVGAWAPVLMLIVRCIQGLSVGGEYGATATYMSEIASSGRRGFYSSFQYVTLIGGQLLASLLAVIMTSTLGEEAITNGWWRLPFVIGALAAVVSLWLRNGLEETTSSTERSEEGAGTLRQLMQHPRSFWVVLGITAIGSLTFYTYTTYMQKFLINTGGFAKGDVARTMTVCLFVFMILQPLTGLLSDKIGRKNTILIFGVASTVGTIPAFMLLEAQSTLIGAGAVIILIFVFESGYTSISGILKAEMFPTYIRGLGVGFTYAVGNSLFGGSAEYVALGLKNAGHANAFPIYVTVMAALGVVAMLFLHDSRTHSTIDNPESSAYAKK